MVVGGYTLYNYQSRKYISEVNQRYAEVFGEFDYSKEYPHVEAEFDLAKAEDFLAVINDEELMFGSITDLPLFENHPTPSYKRNIVDLLKWPDVGELGTEEAAAKILDLVASEYSQFAAVDSAIDDYDDLTSSYSKPLTLEGMFDYKGFNVMQFISVERFYRERATLHLLAGDNQSAMVDYDRLQKVRSLVADKRELISYLVLQAMDQGVSSLIAFGIQKHLWSSDDLLYISRTLPKYDYLGRYKDAMRFEGYYQEQFTKLIREHGAKEVMSYSYKTIAEMFSELVNEVDALDFSDYLEGVELATIAISFFPSEYYPRSIAASDDKLATNLPPFLKSGSIREYRKLLACDHTFAIYESASRSNYDAFVDQARTVIDALAHSRMRQIALELELEFLRSGRYPEKISELSLADALRVDPYTDKAFVYGVSEISGFTLYSEGPQDSDLYRQSNTIREIDRRLYFFVEDK
jgi:hypothetical protein